MACDEQEDRTWARPVPFTEQQQRHMALDFAVRTMAPDGVVSENVWTDIVAGAQKYLDFLMGKPTQPDGGA